MWAALTKDFAEIANNIKSDSMHFVNMISDLANDVMGDSNTIYAGDEALWANNSQHENTTNEAETKTTSEKENMHINLTDVNVSSNADSNSIAKSSTPMGYNEAQYKSRPMPVIDNTSLIDLQGSDSTYLAPITNNTADKNNNNNNNAKYIEKEFALWKATSPLSSYNLRRSMQRRQKQKQQREEQTTNAAEENEKDKKEIAECNEQRTNDFTTPTRSATEGSENSPSPASPLLSLFATHQEPTYAIRQRLLSKNELIMDKYINLVCEDNFTARSQYSPRSTTQSVTRETDNEERDKTTENKESNDKEHGNVKKDVMDANKSASPSSSSPAHSPSSPFLAHSNKRLTEDEFFDRYFFRLSQLREAAAASAAKQNETQAKENDNTSKENNAVDVENNTKDKEKHMDPMPVNTNNHTKKSKDDVYVPATCTNTEHDNSEDDITEVEWATKELSSIATCVLQAANKFASNLDDVINLGMNAQEESTDDDNVTPPSSLTTSPLTTGKLNKQLQQEQVSIQETTKDTKKIKRNEQHEQTKEEEEYDYDDDEGNDELNAYKTQIVGLENVIQQLQERVRVTDRRVGVLTKLLQEHNIAIPPEELMLRNSHSPKQLTHTSNNHSTVSNNDENATETPSIKVANDANTSVTDKNVESKENKGADTEKVETIIPADHELVIVDSNASSSVEEWEQINAADCELEHTTSTKTNKNEVNVNDNNDKDKKKQENYAEEENSCEQ